MTQLETNLSPSEGLIPPPVKNGVPRPLQIPIINPLAGDNFMDLDSQYGDEEMGNITHAPKLGAHIGSLMKNQG